MLESCELWNKKQEKQAGADLRQAQVKLGLAKPAIAIQPASLLSNILC